MKKYLLIIQFAFFILANYAQAPQGLNYQAVVRTSSGQTVANNTPVKLRFTIHDGSASGTAVYSEIITDTTNPFGLVNVQIGSSGNLATVNWGSGAKFLQVETDVNNSSTYNDMGTSQLLSVPYALYAANSAMGPQGPAGVTGATGPQGASGVTGNDGMAGATGPQGTTGNNGTTGATGPQGAPGVTGSDGLTGATGAVGTGANMNVSNITASGAGPYIYTYIGTGTPLFLVISIVTSGQGSCEGSVSVQWENSTGTIIRAYTKISGTNIGNGNDGGSGMSDQELATVPFLPGSTVLKFTSGGCWNFSYNVISVIDK